MDVGTTLRTARERRNLRLTDVSVATKIPVRVLLAMEENEFHKVPSGIFVRGYLRAYAREVRLDPEDVLEQYRAQSGEAAPAPALAPEVTRSDAQEIEESWIDPNATGSGPGWAYALIVAALLVAVISVNRSGTDDVTEGALAEPQPAPAAATAEPAVANSGDKNVLAVATAGQGVRFEFEAQGPCWVEAVVDGRKVVYRLMKPGERQTIEPQRDLVLRIGDPGAFAYSVNGKQGEPLGKPGVPATVRFTSQGERIALAS
jgi:cytoskeleton protein RodZ